ncbi:MAG: hypothetical protein LBE65_05365 [Synergistaceae bacterium]|jgi:hypothetical protein|nr:hypothetical protein [Synergistaceae bacterium]
MREILESKKILVALLLCFVLVAVTDVIIPGKTYMPDENAYLRQTKSVAETGILALGEHRAANMPIPMIIYAPFYRLLGNESVFIKFVRVIQALAHIVTAIGAASIAFSIFKNRATAIITLFGTAIYPSLLAYQCLLLTETLFTCFLVLGFAFLYAWRPERPGAFVLSGLCFMLSLYTRPVITMLMPLLFLARGFVIFDHTGRRLRYCLYSCIIFLVCAAPWWIRNWNIFGEFVPFTTYASRNLYLGNNRGNFTGGVEWSTDAPPEEVAELLSAGSETEISRAFTAKSISYIRENKVVFLANAWKKFKRFWNFTLNTDSAKLPKYFQYYNIASILSWGTAFFLALATLWRKRKEWFVLLPLFLLVGYYVFVHVVTIASLRYRLPIEPFFVILGADSLRVIFERSGVGKSSVEQDNAR